MQSKAKDIINQVKKVIVGKDGVIEKILMTILAGGHILLEDVPGVGKTQMALSFSKVMNLQYKRMQFTPDTMASDITGFSVYNRQTGNFDYKEGAVMCNLLLADEINRTSPKTQAALLEVMEEKTVTVDGVTRKVKEPFICFGTQNPIGSSGTSKLPDSQLDRFMIRLSIGYPDVKEQVEIVKQRQHKNPINSVEEVVLDVDIIEMRQAVRNVKIQDDVIEYAAILCKRTREVESIQQGASPRAVLALVDMSKAAAFVDNRDYVTPEDVKKVFVDVCAHRIMLTSRATIRKETAEEILNKILRDTKIPQILKG